MDRSPIANAFQFDLVTFFKTFLDKIYVTEKPRQYIFILVRSNSTLCTIWNPDINQTIFIYFLLTYM